MLPFSLHERKKCISKRILFSIQFNTFFKINKIIISCGKILTTNKNKKQFKTYTVVPRDFYASKKKKRLTPRAGIILRSVFPHISVFSQVFQGAVFEEKNFFFQLKWKIYFSRLLKYPLLKNIFSVGKNNFQFSAYKNDSWDKSQLD